MRPASGLKKPCVPQRFHLEKDRHIDGTYFSHIRRISSRRGINVVRRDQRLIFSNPLLFAVGPSLRLSAISELFELMYRSDIFYFFVFVFFFFFRGSLASHAGCHFVTVERKRGGGRDISIASVRHPRRSLFDDVHRLLGFPRL